MIGRFPQPDPALGATPDPAQMSPEDYLKQLGLDQAPAALPTTVDPIQQTRLQQFLEGLGGLQNIGGGAPQSLGAGFVQGLAGGLGRAGSRIQAERQKYEATASARAAANDLMNRKATEDYRKERTAALTTRTKQASDNPTVTQQMIDAAPAGSPIKRLPVGTQVSRSALDTAMLKEPKQTTAEIEAEAAARARGMKAGNPDKTPAQIRAEAKARTEGEAAGKGVTSTGPAADDQYKELALQYVRTGNFPRNLLGPDDRAAFRQYVHANYPAMDIAKNSAQYRADQTSLQKQQVNLDQVTTSSNTLSNSIANLRGVMDQVPDTGIPAANGLVRGVAQMFGNDAVPQYNQALHVVQNESARILGGSWNGGGTILESEKKDMQAVQSGKFTRKQLAHVVDMIESDKIGRLNAGRKQVNAVKARLDWADTGQGDKPIDTQWYGSVTQQGNHYSVTDPNGKVHPFTTRAQANSFIEQANQANGY